MDSLLCILDQETIENVDKCGLEYSEGSKSDSFRWKGYSDSFFKIHIDYLENDKSKILCRANGSIEH